MIKNIPTCPFCEYAMEKRKAVVPFSLVCPGCCSVFWVELDAGKYRTSKDCDFNRKKHAFRKLKEGRFCLYCDKPAPAAESIPQKGLFN